ncbi:hypothetical protein COEREDRAFT_5971 [Coemansia reversa NRRL 1564]|uniref:Phosphatidate phosphatase APP1 catalytic domain-containing protein n=1 Tax=Coemansia reversa (strain ATCC 12441 / NRRL 1564) TaxID=763665 RepID=A0A2G5BIE4_COERN|nr:hypothetical protein COEREDRAFT_5971 [Coemansia reversa NRRL 1564]|eukprot:PIA18788.1 hypothetical protein COEREDRAFT_5971 [Coemansia reversa NRRL 1564]
MSQRDFDAVKTRLRGLWTQYSTSDVNNTSSNVSSSGNSTESNGFGSDTMRGGAPVPVDASVSAAIEELVLFPTYAYRDERLKVWRVQVRGWGFSRNPSARKVRVAASLMRRFIRVAAGGAADQMLVDRISYLFASAPQTSNTARVAMAGVAEPEPFALGSPHGGLAYSHDESSQKQQPISLLDAPLVLEPPLPLSSASSNRSSGSGPRHTHDQLVVGQLQARPAAEQRQKAQQIDAFAWQSLTLDDGQFQGEILVGYNELEWLLQSRTHSPHSRRLIAVRGRLAAWTGGTATAAGVAHLVEPHGISVVSDIDDTIKASNITAEKRIVLETVFAQPLRAVPGMAELYNEWYEGGCEFHYVSNSPWQLYPALDNFFQAHQFPPGSAHLRSFDANDLLSISNYTGTPQLKRDTIELLLRTFPGRTFILVGDSGEQDLETYTDLARRFPGRIARIFIRDLFAPMAVPTLTTDTRAAGNTAVRGLVPYGFVQPRALPGNDANHMDGGKNVGDESNLIHLSPSDNDWDRTSRPPPLPPKPLSLRGPRVSSTNMSPVPPPKPPRSAVPRSATAMGPVSTVGQDAHMRPVVPPRRTATQPQQPMPGTWASTPQDAATMLQARIQQVRQQAQQWLAFYAQRFYVAPTHSFLQCAHVFLPAVERDPRIIDYDSVKGELDSDESGTAPAAATTRIVPEIPEPPPEAAQLARNERRLQLWRRFLGNTRDLAPGLCQLFVDATDIRQDRELFTDILPRFRSTQL